MLAELFVEYRAPLLSLAGQLLLDRSAAEDVVQETFLLAHRFLAGFRAEARLYTWLYRIAIRLATRERRRDAARRRRTRALDPESPALAAPEADPASRRELREQVAGALVALPVDARVVLSLSAIEGLSHREIAEILGIPDGTVWSRLHHARRKLRASLASYLEVER